MTTSSLDTSTPPKGILTPRLTATSQLGFSVVNLSKINLTKDQISAFDLFTFRNHLVLTLWGKTMIKSIPTGVNKNRFVPLNCRGISLISCVSKAYSALLNNRIVGYCNMLDIFVDE